jgi:hypothetical protein
MQPEPVSGAEASAYLARQSRFDSDLWIIGIEDKHGRHFLGDDAIEE